MKENLINLFDRTIQKKLSDTGNFDTSKAKITKWINEFLFPAGQLASTTQNLDRRLQILAKEGWAALAVVLVSVKNWHDHFGQAFWNIHVFTLSSWLGFGSSERCKTEEEWGNSAAGKVCSPSLYSCSDFWGELSESWQEFCGWDAVWHCFLGWFSLLLGLTSSHSPPFFCDLELNCWIGLGHLCHLGLVTTTKGKWAAARPNLLMLSKCFTVIQQKEQIIVQYSWKAGLSTVCLPRGIYEWFCR